MNHVEACFHTLLMEALWRAHILHTFITAATEVKTLQANAHKVKCNDTTICPFTPHIFFCRKWK